MIIAIYESSTNHVYNHRSKYLSYIMGILLLLIIETHTNKCLSKSRYNDSQNIKNLILRKGHSIPYPDFNLKIIFSVSRNLNLLGFGPFFP